MTVTILQAETQEQLESIRSLWHEYMNWDAAITESLGLDVSELLAFAYENGQFQLPGVFVPPDGGLFLALSESHAAGCGAWRRLNDTTCEVKRMYVRPAFRGKRVGKSLLQTLIEDARQQGLTRFVLETVTFMAEAQGLYTSLGFLPIAPYTEVPDELKPITLFMELRLYS